MKDQKREIFWSVLAVVTLTGWNVSFGQPPRSDVVAEAKPVVQPPAQVSPAQRLGYVAPSAGLPVQLGDYDRDGSMDFFVPAPGAGAPVLFDFGQGIAFPGFPMTGAAAVEAGAQLPSDARELLKRYEGERKAIQKTAEEQVRARRQKLIEDLKPLQDKYTREAKLDEAVAIRDLIRVLKEPVENVLPDPGASPEERVTTLARAVAEEIAKDETLAGGPRANLAFGYAVHPAEGADREALLARARKPRIRMV